MRVKPKGGRGGYADVFAFVFGARVYSDRPQLISYSSLLLVNRRDDHLLDALPFILHRERGGRCGAGVRREGSATGRTEGDLASEQPCLTTEQAHLEKQAP